MNKGREIISGLFREGQLCTLSGSFNCGKSPLLMDWAFSIATGTPWCNHRVVKKPVLLLSHESPEWQFRPDWSRLSARNRVPAPAEPHEFECYLEHGSTEDPKTAAFLDIMAKGLRERMGWFAQKIEAQPDLVVMIDPFDLFWRIDRNKSDQVMNIYHFCKKLWRKSPRTTFIFSFNLRKKNRTTQFKINLLDDPRDWLEETSGSLDIQSRSDVRIGLAYHGDPSDGVRVMNGVRRSEQMEPMLIESVVVGEGENGEPLFAGYTPLPTTRLMADISSILSPKMLEMWNALDTTFTDADLTATLSRSSAYRFKQRLLEHGLIAEPSKGVYRKAVAL